MNQGDISIEKIEEFPDATFIVSIKSADSAQTKHRVKLQEQYYKQLTDGIVTPQRLVHASILFLLDREPQESILEDFDLPIISRYFPEYETAIQKIIKHV